MRNIDQNIKSTMKRVLDNRTSGITFQSVWSLHNSKNKGQIRYKRVALVPIIVLVTLLTLFTVGYANLSYKDDVNIPFVDDPEVIGNWQAVDFVSKINDFDPKVKSVKSALYLNNLVFLESGKLLDRYDNTRLYYSMSTWTKGILLCAPQRTASKYEIREIKGSKYMFLEWKSGDYTIRFMKPKYYVLKQIDTKDYADYKVEPSIEDAIDMAFENNPELLGRWISIDYVREINDFTLDKKSSKGTLYLLGMNILEQGKLTSEYNNIGVIDKGLSWTGDLIVDYKDKTASKCLIKTIKKEKYMFFEWKSSDYTDRGMKPGYYVLKKIK